MKNRNGLIVEVDSMDVGNCGLTNEEFINASLIYTIAPFQDMEAFVLKNKFGKSGFIPIEDLEIYKSLVKKSIGD